VLAMQKRNKKLEEEKKNNPLPPRPVVVEEEVREFAMEDLKNFSNSNVNFTI
jgi:hypothetical protein